MAVALALALTACSADPEPDVVKSPVAPNVSSASAPAVKPAAAVAKPLVALDAEGLRLVDPATGSTALLAFGAPRAQVDRAMGLAIAAAPEKSAFAECGAGPMEFSRFDGLSINYLEGRFVGWRAEENTRAKTMNGIGPGMTREQLMASGSQVAMVDSTLDGEFALAGAGGPTIGGFIGKDTRVSGLFAGVNCFFR